MHSATIRKTAVAVSIFATTAALSQADEGMVFFESKIRPALIQHCYECHSEADGKKKGGLWLDRKAGWEVGGNSGPAAIRGDVDGMIASHELAWRMQTHAADLVNVERESWDTRELYGIGDDATDVHGRVVTEIMA